MSKTFSQQAEAIRQDLRQFDKQAFMVRVLNFLHDESGNQHIEARKMPGLSYLALEWLYQVDQLPNAPSPTEQQVNQILNRIYRLQDLVVNIKEDADYELVIRRLLLAQLWYQRNPRVHLADICRSYALMEAKGGSSWFQDQMQTHYGVKLEDVFFLITFLTVNFMNKGHLLEYTAVLPKLMPKYEPEYLARLIRLIGKPLHEVEVMLAESKAETLRPSEYFKDPVLLECPVILRNDDFLLIHRPLFIRSMGILVRRLFTKIDKAAFVERYSKQFERYVDVVLKEAGFDFLTEEDIEGLYKAARLHGQRKVDFVVKASDASIFIDAKGVDPLEQVRNSDSPKFIFDKSKQLQSGVRQAFSAAKNLEEIRALDVRERGDRFAMVITNLDFGIPDGTRLGNLDERFFPGLIAEYGDLIDPKNVFILSIEDFEGICRFCGEGACSMGEFLRECAERDSNRATRRLTIRQHLDAISEEKTGEIVSGIGTNYVDSYVQKLMDEARDVFSDAESYWGMTSMADLRKVIEYDQVRRRFLSALDLSQGSSGGGHD